MRRALVVALTAVAALAVTAGPAFAAAPPNPAWTSSDPSGQWNDGQFIVYNNSWNGSAGPQTIWANSYHSWGVESTQAAGNTAVETYPCVGVPYDNLPVASFKLIRNGFTESMPANTTGLHAEAADDVWLNNYGLEIMIWTDNVGQSFSGDPKIGHTKIGGQNFSIYRNGSEFIFALDHNETSGKTHILASIDWLIRHGYAQASATLSQVDYGWEVSSTNGQPEDFTMSNYWLHTQRS
jgi:hypothetical protein